ncbi:MAG: hypothetical protein AB3A66_30135 (plasmid) [Nodularia sp. CChRGM 3473]
MWLTIPKVVKAEPDSVANRPALIRDHLQNWHNVADKLGKPEQYKQRILEVAGELDSGQQLCNHRLCCYSDDFV